MRNKIFFIPLSVLVLAHVAAPGQSEKGLVGLLYDDTKLERVSSVWYQESANSGEANWPVKNDFSIRCFGYIKVPVSGKVTFYGEADNEMQLVVDNKAVINTWDNIGRAEGAIPVKQGRFYPVILLYRQISGSSYMRIYWSWEGHPKEIIPASAFSFDENNEKKAIKEFSAHVNADLTQLDFDVASIIEIHQPDDVLAKRKAVVGWLWGADGFPSQRMPDEIMQGIKDSGFISLENLKRIDKLVVNMDYGMNSVVYHFIPEKANGSSAIYHQGHRGKFSLGFRTINAFLSKGYDVFALSMPLLGMNSKPAVDFDRFGKMMLFSHDLMRFLNPAEGHHIKYFMEPVAAVVNYAQQFNFNEIIMVGISGGGWTTTLYAAIDHRVRVSIPVAGSLPNYLRARDMASANPLGDYEQKVPQLYRIANYLELYIMGSYGPGRSQFQILNEFDACCFRGAGFRTYEDIVRNRVNSLGDGTYDVFLDSTHRLHQISPKALEVIFEFLENH